MRHRRAAYYGRNDSYSRSYNAERAEAEGRLPRLRAARHLGLNAAAFDAGCAACGYVATEWHHVGRYATRIDYYDCVELSALATFWRGASAAYRTKAKQEEMLARADEAERAAREARIEEHRDRLIAQRDCSRPVRRHDGTANWRIYVDTAARAAGICLHGYYPPKGDMVALRAAIAAREERMHAAEARKTVLAMLASAPASVTASGLACWLVGAHHVRITARRVAVSTDGSQAEEYFTFADGIGVVSSLLAAACSVRE